MPFLKTIKLSYEGCPNGGSKMICKRTVPGLTRSLLIALAIAVLAATSAGAEGLLPSLGEALNRYPDEEISDADGGSTEVFRGVTETDFIIFSAYLSEKSATLAEDQAAGTASPASIVVDGKTITYDKQTLEAKATYSASIVVDGKTIAFTYDPQTLEARATYPMGTCDEWLDYAKTQFESAIRLLENGKKQEGVSVLITIPNYSGYRQAAEYLEAHPELVAAAAEREAQLAPFREVGGYVTFGSYEQDNNTANGREPVEWLVLDYDKANQRVLLLSRHGLDAKPYNKEYVDITWENCTLRAWLNGEFMDSAFSGSEQGAILTTSVDNSKSQGSGRWDTNGGNGTQDKIFLLSYAEANKYLGVTREDDNKMKSTVSPTAYATKQGAYTSGRNQTADGAAAGWWWLRSPGYNPSDAARVGSGGSISRNDVHDDGGCVRPALWINLESVIF